MFAYLPYKKRVRSKQYRKFVNQRCCNYQKFNQILENSAKKCKCMFHIRHLYNVARLTNNVKGIDLLNFGVFFNVWPSFENTMCIRNCILIIII